MPTQQSGDEPQRSSAQTARYFYEVLLTLLGTRIHHAFVLAYSGVVMHVCPVSSFDLAHSGQLRASRSLDWSHLSKPLDQRSTKVRGTSVRSTQIGLLILPGTQENGGRACALRKPRL